MQGDMRGVSTLLLFLSLLSPSASFSPSSPHLVSTSQRSSSALHFSGLSVQGAFGRRASNARINMQQGDMQKTLDVFTSYLSSLARPTSGTFVIGYKAQPDLDYKNPTMELPVREFSETLPSVKPKKPLELYEFEACPFCRKVREAISMLDLDVMIYPCPRDGERFRPKVVDMGGKAQFPYLVDPNTDFKAYESDKIIKYLVQTYGDGIIPLPLTLGPLTTVSASIPSLLRSGRGRQADKSSAPQPELPLRLWSFESSPYCRIVRERLCELEVPYQLFTVARGSRKREELKEIAGKVQVPYLVDPNTGKSMFESSSILDYLDETYGKGYAPKVEEKVEEVSPRASEFNVVPEDPEPVKVDAEILEDSEEI